jgi:hypothetical protein
MRQLLTILVIAVLGYFGWNYYEGHKDSFPESIPFLSNSDDSTPSGTREGTNQPIPQFVSKVKIPEMPPDAPPGSKPMAAPGYFFMLDRVSVEVPDGVIAIVPGDLVKVIRRKDNGKLRVTNDRADFDVKEEQITQDPEIAQIAEKRDYDKRFHNR